MQGSISSPGESGSSRYTLPQLDASRPYGAEADPQYGMQRYARRSRSNQMVKALGWFSIGLGVAELLAPRSITRTAGVTGNPNVVRACGAREMVSGVGILSEHKTSRWLWSRVAGDMLDLALLGVAARRFGARRDHVAWTAAAIAGVTALDVMSSMQRSRYERETGIEGAASGIHVEKSITVNRTPDECYQFWRNVENFPRFMQHLKSVDEISATRSHWTAKGPAGISVKWDAEIVADEPGALLAWRSVEDAQVDNAGIVRFERAPGGRGTIVRVELQYSPPGGTAGALFAKLFGEAPEQQIDDDLRHFKQLLEAGEIPTTVGQPSGRRSVLARMFRKGAPG